MPSNHALTPLQRPSRDNNIDSVRPPRSAPASTMHNPWSRQDGIVAQDTPALPSNQDHTPSTQCPPPPAHTQTSTGEQKTSFKRVSHWLHLSGGYNNTSLEYGLNTPQSMQANGGFYQCANASTQSEVSSLSTSSISNATMDSGREGTVPSTLSPNSYLEHDKTSDTRRFDTNVYIQEQPLSRAQDVVSVDERDMSRAGPEDLERTCAQAYPGTDLLAVDSTKRSHGRNSVGVAY